MLVAASRRPFPFDNHRAESIPLSLRPLALPFESPPFRLPIPFGTHDDNVIFVRRCQDAGDTEAE